MIWELGCNCNWTNRPCATLRSQLKLFFIFQVLCLSPTYELALQTGEVASRMSQFAPELTIRYAVRGEEIPRGSTVTDHIIIGTPGKVQSLHVI